MLGTLRPWKVTRHLGRISLAIALASWVVYVTALYVGGLDPPPSRVPLLRAAVSISMLLPLPAVCLSVVALILGPQKVSAMLALFLSVLYGLMVTGILFALFA